MRGGRGYHVNSEHHVPLYHNDPYLYSLAVSLCTDSWEVAGTR